ncbi:MAG: hypothetical protein AB9891_00595 [Anaerolineaceae bacterium]
MRELTFYLLALAVMVLAGCSATGSAVQAPAMPETTPAGLPATTAAATVTPMPAHAGGTTKTPALTPTPDTRLKPEKWQEWPVAPEEFPDHLKKIYQRGQELGNQANHFSKVGDCQSIQEALLGMFEKGKPYRLSQDDKELEKTIAQFAGSFARDGQAVQGGYNAASVLSPLWANPDVCRPGETPLDCELRVYQPSYVIISLEIAFPGRTTEAYEKYMRQIIDRAFEKGVIPILVTKADDVEGDHSINLATARLAYEYDIPLVNWWLAAQSMPNKGFDQTRDDGFHISMEAWTERSLQVMKTLHRTWKSVTASRTTASVEPTATTQVSAATPDASVELEVLALPGGQALPRGAAAEADQAYFGLAKRVGEVESSMGVYRLDLQSGARSILLGEGYNLQAVSPDGSQLLVNKGSELYIAGSDGSNPVLLTSSFHGEGRQGALWQTDGKALVFIAGQAGGNLLVYYPLDGSGWQKLTIAEDDPVELYSAPAGSYQFLDRDGKLKIAAAPGLPGEVLDQVSKIVYSPDGHYLASTVEREGDKTGLVIAAADGSRETPIENIGDHIIDTAWSPDGTSLAVLTLVQSEYSGEWYDLRNMVITPADMGTRLLPAIGGLNARAVWAPDGSSLLFTSTAEKDGVYLVQVYRYDFSSGLMTDLSEAAGMKDSDFLMVTNIYRR